MLEEILQRYFGCEGKVFLYIPDKDNPFTDEGYAAYQKLLDLLWELNRMDVLSTSVVSRAIDMLDCIAND